MKLQNNRIIAVTLVIFTILTILLGGYIVYDKVITKPNNNAESKSDDSISVSDAVNYTDTYYNLFKVKLPKIEGINSKTVTEINEKILNDVLPRTYAHVICHAEGEDNCMDKGSTVNYSYAVKNNIVAIYVYSSVPNGANAMSASGDGLFYYNYFYDISNDKVLNLGEAAEKMGITDIDGASTYEDLNNVCSSMIIEGDTITLDYMEGGC